MTIKLPEPKGYFHEWTEYGRDENWQAITCQFDHFHEDDEPFFTESQLKQAMRDALEEAAKIAHSSKSQAEVIAPFEDRIRKLKEQL